MGIFDKLQDRVRERLNNPILQELAKEQSLRDLLLKREFRLPEGYIQREFVSRAMDDEILELSLAIYDDYAEITGKVKKRLIPFPISFSGRFTIQGLEFSPARKVVFLKLDQVAPIDIDWITKKVIQRIPFLETTGDLIVCDLMRIPKLAEIFSRRIKGLSVWDFITLKELTLKQGEIVGRVGVVL
jgi:hypothetical protein